jgi:tryptophan-rich sensory protein
MGCIGFAAACRRRGIARRSAPMMDASSLLALLAFIAPCFLAALTGAFFRPGEWYERLKKPSWRPPNRIFAPVWSVLYLMIAVSGWLVWRERGFTGAALALTVYGVQLALNAAWTPLFFGLHRPGLGLVDIVLLWMSIVATIVLFWPIHLAAALLLVPYLAWVTFAAALNFALWRLNPSAARG